MFLNAYEFGRKIENAVVYDDAKVALQSGAGVEKISGASLPKLLKKFQEINARRKAEGLGILALALPLSACGGGSSSTDSGADDTPAVVYDTISSAGRAIDGYLADSTVSFATFALPDAPAAPTLSTSNAAGAQGRYSLEITDQATLAFIDAQGGLGSVSVKGGVDVSTGKNFTGELKAPEGSAVITPITTLVEAVVSQAKATGAEPVTPEAAAAQVAKGLGLSTSSDLLNTDFVASGSAGMAKAAAKVASVISVVTASSGESASAAVISNIATKVAKAGSVGGKAKVLEDTTELAAVLNEVRESTPEAFAAAPETLDIAKLNESIASVVAKTNTQIEAATSLKEIAVKQQAVQEDIVESFTIDYEDTEALAAFDFEVFEASITAADENFDAFIAEAEAEMEAYIAESAEILGIDFDVVLDVTDVDATVVAIDLDLIDAAIEGTIQDELLTGFVFGDVDESILDGVIEGTIDQSAVDDILADLPEYDIFPDVPDVPDGDGDGDLPDTGGETPDVEIPDDILDELPDEIVDLITGGGGGGGGVTTPSSADYSLTTADDIQTTINSATDVNGDGSIVIELAAGRYDQNINLTGDMYLWGAQKGVSITTDLDSSGSIDAVNEVAFDVADAQRTSGTGESWINGTVTISGDGNQLDGLRLHSYNGPLQFSGTDIDAFNISNSYITGFNGSQAISYNDTDGTASTGWIFSGNLIGGVAGGVGGSLNLDGISDSTISGNVFWRPGAAHMYLTDVSNVSVSSNFFVQGLHADGANSDGLLDDLVATSEWGYVGFSGGEGYGNVGGYGYGFGYGYDGSVSITSMGYGYGSEGGYGPSGSIPSGYGITSDAGGGTSYTYHGRNYVAEVKGVSSDVTFSGNTAKYNSGGIQFWDENSSSNYFTDITISNNTFDDFLNADPDGLLASVSSRHKSGLMGGVTYSVVEDSASSGLTISGNTFTGNITQIHNDNDIDSLILVQGGVDTVTVSSNTLDWEGSSLSDTASSMTSQTVNSLSGVKVYTQGIHLAGDVTGDIAISSNTFDTDDIASGYASDAIKLDGTDQSSLGLGQLDPSGNDDANPISISSNTFDTAIVDSTLTGGYATTSDEYASLSVSGAITADDADDYIIA